MSLPVCHPDPSETLCCFLASLADLLGREPLQGAALVQAAMCVPLARTGHLACAAVFILAAVCVHCGASPVLRDSRFVLPTSPNNATWSSSFSAQPLSATAVTGFVRARGTEFVADGKPAFFAGSNNFFLALRFPPWSCPTQLEPPDCSSESSSCCKYQDVVGYASFSASDAS